MTEHSLLLCATQRSRTPSSVTRPCVRPRVSACHIAEAVGRRSPADKARVFGIARGELLEVAAALEIAAIAYDTRIRNQSRCRRHHRPYALLTGLSR
jgi:four helix bundle protein